MKGTAVLPCCPRCDGFLRTHCDNCSNTGEVMDWQAMWRPTLWAFGGPLGGQGPEVLKPCPMCLGSPLLAERTICYQCNRVDKVQRLALGRAEAA